MHAIIFACATERHRTGLQSQVQAHDDECPKDASRPWGPSLPAFGLRIQRSYSLPKPAHSIHVQNRLIRGFIHVFGEKGAWARMYCDVLPAMFYAMMAAKK